MEIISLNCLSQQYNTVSEIYKYLESNITSLDPIEGKYSVYINARNGSPFAKKDDTYFNCFILKRSSSSFGLYREFNGQIERITTMDFSRIGDTNVYFCTLMDNSVGRLYLTNKTQLSGSISLTKEDGRKWVSNPNFAYWVVVDFDFVKSYPTNTMYTNAYNQKNNYPTDNSKGQNWGGTGFALLNNYVITNYHVVEGAKTIVVQGINGDFNLKSHAYVIASDKVNDLSILKLEDTNINYYGGIPYSIKSISSDVGEDVFVLGYPLTSTMGDEIKLSSGIISSKTGFQGDVSLYQISTPLQPGNSGGPLFDSKGNIIGIVSSKHSGAENVGYAIKTSYLFNLVETAVSSKIIPKNNTISTLNLSGKVKVVKNFIYYITCSNSDINSSSNKYNSSSSVTSRPSSSSYYTPKQNKSVKTENSNSDSSSNQARSRELIIY